MRRTCSTYVPAGNRRVTNEPSAFRSTNSGVNTVRNTSLSTLRPDCDPSCASPVKDERVYLGHIRDAINDIKSYAAVGEAAFVEHERQPAVVLVARRRGVGCEEGAKR